MRIVGTSRMQTVAAPAKVNDSGSVVLVVVGGWLVVLVDVLVVVELGTLGDDELVVLDVVDEVSDGSVEVEEVGGG